MRILAAASFAMLSACAVESVDDGALSTEIDHAPFRVSVSGLPASPEAPPFQLSKMRVDETDLVSDLQGLAAHQDQTLIDPWGLAFDGTARLWIVATGADHAQAIDASGARAAPSIAVAGAPTGIALTSAAAQSEFEGDTMVMSTESGTIAALPSSGGASAIVRVDNSSSGAVYKGVAITTKGLCNKVVAADFHDDRVDVFADGYAAVADPGFVDPNLPAGYAPFNVFTVGEQVYVAYAMQDAAAHDDAPGPGRGFVSVFAHDGTFQRRLISGGHLNSPWGMTIVPAGWGALSNTLLVANYGDGEINVYDPASGDWKGRLVDAGGDPIVLDGLWAIAVGPKSATADLSDRIFFPAGPGGERHGVVGTLSLLE